MKKNEPCLSAPSEKSLLNQGLDKINANNNQIKEMCCVLEARLEQILSVTAEAAREALRPFDEEANSPYVRYLGDQIYQQNLIINHLNNIMDRLQV